MKRVLVSLLFCLSTASYTQVGINTTTPNAQLEIKSSNEALPANTDGLLIPKAATFPASNPTAAQQGMMVYLTTTSGTNSPGFYYWNNPTLTWVPVGNNNTSDWRITGNTGTNAATNFIGTTDNTDLVFRRFNVVSGRISSSNTFFGRLSGNVSTANNNTYIGTEAGRDNITGQQNVFIGRRSGTFGTAGSDNILIGNGAGIFNEANQNNFIGSFSGNATSTGGNNSFFGYSSGIANTTGSQNTFLGANSGITNIIGIGNTIIGTNANVDANNLTNASAIGFNASVGTSNSMVLGSVNGVNSATATVNVGIGTTAPLDRLHVVGNLRMVDGNQAAGRVLTSDVNGTATWQNATANAWGITGNTGTNPATNFMGTTDNVDLVLKTNSTDNLRIKNDGRIEIGNNGVNPVYLNATSLSKKLFIASETTTNNIVFQASNATSDPVSMYFGASRGTIATPTIATANHNISNIFFSGYDGSKFVTASSINSYLDGTPGLNSMPGRLQFNTTPAGSDSSLTRMTIRSNGNVGVGTGGPLERLHVAGRALLTDGFSADNAALLYQNNSDYMFLGPQSGSSANGAAMALFGSTNVSGGNAGGVDFNVPIGQVKMNHTNGNFIFGANSTSSYNANFELNDVGLEIGHNAAARSILFNPNNTERMRLTPAGNLGIGTNNPLQKLHVSGPAGLTAVRIANTSGVGANSNVALDFFRNTAVNTDWRIYNIGANLTIGNSADDLTTVNDLYQFQGVRFMPMDDATLNLGQAANRWNTLFASNGTINTSDAREKKNIQNLNYGLNVLLQLRPVSFEWKKDDGSGTKLGLIAQELQQIVPEVVRDWDWQEDEQGNRTKVASPILGVYYSDLIPVLIKSIQEQQQIIKEQNNELVKLKAQLENQNNLILQRLEALENKK